MKDIPYYVDDFKSLFVEVNTPEKLLLYEMLCRCLCDAILPITMCDIDARDKTDAIRWLNSYSISPFSFIWTCEHLSDTPEELRDTIKQFVSTAQDFKIRKIRKQSSTFVRGS